MKKIPMLEKFAAQSLIEDNCELIFSKEKFAELIVRECADTIKSNQWAKDNQAFSKGMNYSAELIKEHFGVEE
jgi:hypothetical protein